MSLSRKIAAALDAATGQMPAPVTAQEGARRLTLDVEMATPVGVSCAAVTFHAADRPSWSLDELKAWGDRLAARLTYLMEPLVLHEADADAIEALLRSQNPTARDGRRSYYQVHLSKDGTLRLARYVYDEADRSRKPTSCLFTREVLERLADDLDASVG
jgi:hypothetical protein